MLSALRRWWTRLFGREESPAAPARLADTAPLHAGPNGNLRLGPRTRLEAVAGQSVGLTRENNEDSMVLLYGNSFGEGRLQGFGIFCVADGAGGHGHGEVASAIAARTAARSLVETGFLNQISASGDFEYDVSLLEDMTRQAFQRANRAVQDGAEGGITTLTLAFVLAGRLTIGHVGDSRAYLTNGVELERVTRDHSYPWRLVEIGQITPDEALLHPKRNLLWNAIGQPADLTIEIYSRPVPLGSRLLICSDGLWGEVSEAEMIDCINGRDDLDSAIHELIRAAISAGGPDNITAILVAFPEG